MGIKVLKKSIDQTCAHLSDMSETYAKANTVHAKMTIQLLQEILRERLAQQTNTVYKSARHKTFVSVLEYGIERIFNRDCDLAGNCKRIDQSISEQEKTSGYYEILISYVDILSIDDLAILYKTMCDKPIKESFSFIRTKTARLGLTV